MKTRMIGIMMPSTFSLKKERCSLETADISASQPRLSCQKMSIRLHSRAFSRGQKIVRRYFTGGSNLSIFLVGDLNDDSSYDKYVVDLTWYAVAKGVGAGAAATNQEEGVGGSPKRKRGKKSCD